MAERAPRSRLRIREILDTKDPAFTAAYKLLSRAFSHAELLPMRDWRNAMLERREGLWTDINWHLLVVERGRAVVGAATGAYLGNVNAGIIGYVAVRPDARSLGIGPRVRRMLLRKFEADARHAGWKKLAALVGEVRADNPWLKYLVRTQGIIALDFPYYQPSLGGARDPVPLVLYYQPLDAKRSSIGAAELRRLLYTMWRRSYRVAKPLAHAEFRRMLRALHGRRRVGQRRLGRSRSRVRAKAPVPLE